jgi:hypothetical protein
LISDQPPPAFALDQKSRKVWEKEKAEIMLGFRQKTLLLLGEFSAETVLKFCRNKERNLRKETKSISFFVK